MKVQLRDGRIIEVRPSRTAGKLETPDLPGRKFDSLEALLAAVREKFSPYSFDQG